MNTADSTEPVVAFSGDRLFDGRRTLVDHAVLVKGGNVVDVVTTPDVPPHAERVHERGCTILPGLIDTHVHFMRWQGPQYLAAGVTTIRDTGNRLDWILDRKHEWQDRCWPRILCLGPLLEGPKAYHDVVSRACADRDDALEAVREVVATDVDGVKLYVGTNPDWIAPMLAVAHAAGRKVSMHCSAGGVAKPAEDGLDEFYHLDGILADLWPVTPPGWLEFWGASEFAATLDDQHRLADRIAATAITATPTLAYWDSQWRIRTPESLGADDLRYTPSRMIDWQTIPPDERLSAKWLKALRAAQRFVGMLFERGVPILAGSDVPCGLVPPGRSLWRELELLAESGLSPEQAIRTATTNAADYLERPDLGSLAPGAAADMVVVRGNPLDAIPSRPDIALTVRGGSVHRPADLLGMEQDSLDDEPWADVFRTHWTNAVVAQRES